MLFEKQEKSLLSHLIRFLLEKRKKTYSKQLNSNTDKAAPKLSRYKLNENHKLSSFLLSTVVFFFALFFFSVWKTTTSFQFYYTHCCFHANRTSFSLQNTHYANSNVRVLVPTDDIRKKQPEYPSIIDCASVDFGNLLPSSHRDFRNSRYIYATFYLMVEILT